jgi:hypothetical protein
LVDAFRENAWLTAGGYHVVQFLSLAVVLAALVLLARKTAAGSAAAAPPASS